MQSKENQLNKNKISVLCGVYPKVFKIRTGTLLEVRGNLAG